MNFDKFEKIIIIVMIALLAISFCKEAEAGTVKREPLTPVAPIEAKQLTTVYAGGLLAKCACSGDIAYTGVAGIEYGDTWRIGYMYAGHQMHYLYGKYIADNGLYIKAGAAKRKDCTEAVVAGGIEYKNLFIEVNTAEQLVGGLWMKI